MPPASAERKKSIGSGMLSQSTPLASLLLSKHLSAASDGPKCGPLMIHQRPYL